MSIYTHLQTYLSSTPDSPAQQRAYDALLNHPLAPSERRFLANLTPAISDHRARLTPDTLNSLVTKIQTLLTQIAEAQNPTFITGLPKVGKSTTINYLTGVDYTLHEDAETFEPTLVPAEATKALQIAHSALIPTIATDATGQTYVELPTYSKDSEDEQDPFIRFLVNQALARQPQAKLIVLFDWKDTFPENRGNPGLNNNLVSLVELFKIRDPNSVIFAFSKITPPLRGSFFDARKLKNQFKTRLTTYFQKYAEKIRDDHEFYQLYLLELQIMNESIDQLEIVAFQPLKPRSALTWFVNNTFRLGEIEDFIKQYTQDAKNRGVKEASILKVQARLRELYHEDSAEKRSEGKAKTIEAWKQRMKSMRPILNTARANEAKHQLLEIMSEQPQVYLLRCYRDDPKDTLDDRDALLRQLRKPTNTHSGRISPVSVFPPALSSSSSVPPTKEAQHAKPHA